MISNVCMSNKSFDIQYLYIQYVCVYTVKSYYFYVQIKKFLVLELSQSNLLFTITSWNGLCPNKEIPCSGALPVKSSVYHHILEWFQTTLNNKNSESEQHNPD